MSEINLFGKWKVKRKYFWIGLGVGVPVLCILAFIGVLIISPAMGGASYQVADINDSYGYSSGTAYEYADGGDAVYEAPAMEAMPRNSVLTTGENIDTITANTTGSVATQRLIIREGNISVVVEKTRQTANDIEAIVNGLADKGAYVITASESGRGEDKEPYINIVIRVPVEDFDRVMDQIAAMGIEVTDRNETAQDVTEEYVDLEGRVEALEVAKQRLQEIMLDADTTEDLLMAEQQLTMREAELESLQGRMNYLAQSAQLSRININLQPYELSEPIETGWKPAETFRSAVENLIDSLQGFADFMIVFTIAVLPWFVFFGLIIWGVVALVRKRKSKKQASTPQS